MFPARLVAISSINHVCAHSLVYKLTVSDRSVEIPINSSQQRLVDAVNVNRLVGTNQITDGAKVVGLERFHLLGGLMSCSSVVLKI